MSKEFKFKLSTTQSSGYEDAESLFRDLKNRDPQIQHLWSHQADIFRAYHKDAAKHDIALELPTGAGKTLVGLLIAEWRRITLQQRVAYLCPTKQLAYQVGSKAIQYGIKAHVLVGKQTHYPNAHYSDYASAQAIAITTYSGIFNTNPRIDNPETIILDDAHASENYIAKMWSLLVTRGSSLYNKIVDLYADSMSESFLSTLRDDAPDPRQKQSVDLLPVPKFSRKLQALISLVDAYCTEGNEVSYPWQLLRDRLNACHSFFSWHEILIRPWIPPSLTHPSFANAKQRIYMSATIGAGGELERITGVAKIHRIPLPPGWDKQSTGRRLFIFPDRSFANNEYLPWLTETIKSKNRALVLTPHIYALDSFKENVLTGKIRHKIFESTEVEESLDPFTTAPQSILLLTNRYDGIDLPGDSCRLLIVYGLPASVNLQEKFQWSNLRLSAVLRDRIRTRITQAVGRCTRNSTDYAVLIMADEKLFDFCIKRENRSNLHPELKAEMEFGLDNSEADSTEHLTQLIQLFLDKDLAWKKAEQDITRRRSEVEPPAVSYFLNLLEVAKLEVEYQYDLWREDYEGAIVKATNIVEKLSGDSLAGYRALWNYFIGCTAYQQSIITQESALLTKASERFRLASKAAGSVSWFAPLSHELNTDDIQETKDDYLTTKACESINEYLTKVGTVGSKFEKCIKEYEDGINSSDAHKFDKALTELGEILGFDTEKPEVTAAPDSVWRIGGDCIFLFECKSDESATGEISISTCRQAKGHVDWQKNHSFFTQNAQLIPIVVSPRKHLDKNAVPHAKELFYQHVDTIRELFCNAITCFRVIRSKSSDSEIEQRLKIIKAELTKSDLTPRKIIDRFTASRLSKLKTKSK